MSGLVEYRVTITIHEKLREEFTDPCKVEAFIAEILGDYPGAEITIIRETLHRENEIAIREENTNGSPVSH